MDLGLPDCDGLDVCRRLRDEERTRWVPVIILTGRSTVVDKITGLEVGADDYLTKPFDPGELVARVRAVLRPETNPSARSRITIRTALRSAPIAGRCGLKGRPWP